MFTAIPFQFILHLYLAATFQSPEGGRFIEVELYKGFPLFKTKPKMCVF